MAIRTLALLLLGAIVVTGNASADETSPDIAAALSLGDVEGQGTVVRWEVLRGVAVYVGPPVVSAADSNRTDGLPVEIRIESQSCSRDKAECEYRISIDDAGARQTGTYRLSYTLAGKAERAVLHQRSDLAFDEPVRLNISVRHTIQFVGRGASRCTLPLRNGVVSDFPLDAPESPAGHFALGRGATSSRGHELAMPVVGIEFDGDERPSLAVATDPYCGVEFRFAAGNDRTSITMATTYTGTLVPVRRETRASVVVSHTGGIDGMLSSFYDTIPEIEPGAAWIHDIELNYYDYLGGNGRAWFASLEKLAEKIPAPKRKAVVVNLHGWYDYLGRYAFDRKARKLEDEWTAFPRTRKIPMSKAEIHRRIALAKRLGFRAVLYFADGLNSDSDMPDYPEHWIFHDEHGNARKGWTGPSTGVTYALDPGNPEVRQFFLDYAEALLDEFGHQIDGLVWDETQYITQERLSATSTGLAYADRDFMTLVAELTRRVQRRREENPNLVFLTSDCVGCWGNRHVPYALVSHGTYQDTACNPVAWPPGMLPNYRNCLWSCNWHPLEHAEWNRIAAEEYALPQGLSCGYGDDVGPAKMREAMLDAVIGRFLRRVAAGQRKRFLTEPTTHVRPNPRACTTRDDAAGGCDGVKTGTWAFCTQQENNPWWQVDLGDSAALHRVVIFNRCDGEVEGRAASLRVFLSPDGSRWTEAYRHDGAPFFGHTDGKPLSIPLNGATARFLRIGLPAREYLHLDEVEVYGQRTAENLALRRPADQSSVSRWSTAEPARPPAPK